ncbi:hypothetical protein [Janthinobacterium sp. 1_2014MBL_MicDiv]|uniref:hypothetical protein n=1 Tax=Janthinobacterium sp. 1_2014MBL_MicDiv TaxID=1644131 RepID=UPI0008F47176|nr:hypothetical protein [Janthinobacterium sp. 1_2014MBL_MicDiv]APA69919.1 hypothetical protein YQ44_21390 [Janthinobacterium sp. 1_2014MBL_MicDiv]
MKMRELPISQFKTPLNRRVYSFFLSPFRMCWDLEVSLLIRFLACCPAGFGLATFGWVFMMVFMYFMDALTLDVAFGMAVVAILAGTGITAVFAVLTSF